MESYIQQKRKRGDTVRNQDEYMAVNVKKPANGTRQEPRSGLEGIMIPHLDPPIQLQIPSAKLKLQLFPINKQTRLGLEKDGYNPFLEITLSAQKRISSVVRHLNTKWGCSSSVTGQLVLFPFYTKSEQLGSCRRWTLKDSSFTVWEVYVDVGSPSIFRLRYGWLFNHQMEMYRLPRKSSLVEAHTGCEGKKGSPRMTEIRNHQEKQVNESCEVIKEQSNADELHSDANHQEMQVNDSCEAVKKQSNSGETLHSDANELKASDGCTHLGDDNVTMEANTVCRSVPWDDNLTMLSIGGLLSEISLQGKISGSDPSSVSRSVVQPTSSSAISFSDLLSESSLFGKMRCASRKLENDSSLQPLILGSSDISIGGLFSEASILSNKNKSDAQPTEAGHALVQSPWDDNFTTLSIGGLLSEESLQAKTGVKVELRETISSLETFAPSQSKKPKPPMHESNLSILDAEETCHAFPFKKLQSSRDITASNGRVGSGGCSNDTNFKQSHFPWSAKMDNGTAFPKDSSGQGVETDTLTGALGTFDEDNSLWPFRHQSAGAG